MSTTPARFYLVLAAGLIPGCAQPGRPAHPAPPATALELSSEYIMGAGSPGSSGPTLGGLSGIVPLRDGRELLAISDDRENSRIYRLRLSEDASTFKVEVVGVIPLEAAPGASARLDPEGIALTADGHILISSEGIGREPRLPPAIIEYTPDGRFVRNIEVHPRFAPNAHGPLTTGVRGNAGFESLTTTPDFEKLYTGSELPLAQDGAADPFASDGRCRLLEYTRRNGTYVPTREFVYEIAPLQKPPYETAVAVNGLVELLTVNATELLAMERGYVESADGTSSTNRIRIFRISSAGATDVSNRASLRGATTVVPVRKTLLVDLNLLPGLSPALRKLDNFEGLAWGPSAPDGRRGLILVSDDNFNARQVTAFLLLREMRSAGALR